MAVPLLRKLFPTKDPYWDRFVNLPFADPKNLVLDLITSSAGGGVSAAKMDVHDPAAMAGHMLQLAKFWDVDAGAVMLTDPAWLPPEGLASVAGQPVDAKALAQELPWAIVCGVRRDFDVAAQGMGGRLAEQKLAVANFNIRSYIREIGFNAIFATPAPASQAAVAAGLGTLDKDGRFVSKQHGDRLVLGQVVLTDLPMQPQG